MMVIDQQFVYSYSEEAVRCSNCNALLAISIAYNDMPLSVNTIYGDKARADKDEFDKSITLWTEDKDTIDGHNKNIDYPREKFHILLCNRCYAQSLTTRLSK